MPTTMPTRENPDSVDMSPLAIEQRLECVRRLHRAMQRLAAGALTGPVAERVGASASGDVASPAVRR